MDYWVLPSCLCHSPAIHWFPLLKTHTLQQQEPFVLQAEKSRVSLPLGKNNSAFKGLSVLAEIPLPLTFPVLIASLAVSSTESLTLRRFLTLPCDGDKPSCLGF